MHHFITILLSLLFALCHHTSLTARPVEAAEIRSVQVTTSEASPALILPDRYHFARASASYSENECLSCRRMDDFSNER